MVSIKMPPGTVVGMPRNTQRIAGGRRDSHGFMGSSYNPLLFLRYSGARVRGSPASVSNVSVPGWNGSVGSCVNRRANALRQWKNSWA